MEGCLCVVPVGTAGLLAPYLGELGCTNLGMLRLGHDVQSSCITEVRAMRC